MAETTQKIFMPTFRVAHNGGLKTLGILGMPERMPFSGSGGMPFARIHPLIERLNSELGTNLRLVAPLVADQALNYNATKWELLASVSPFAVNAAISYEKPKRKLEAQVVFETKGELRVVMPTGRYKGEKGIALVVLDITSADIKTVENEIRIEVPDSRIVPVEGFPKESCQYYSPHHKTGIPHGEAINYSRVTRLLWRIDDAYVGPLVRYVDRIFGDGRQNVLAVYKPSVHLGVIVEIPEGNTPEQLNAAVLLLEQLRR